MKDQSNSLFIPPMARPVNVDIVDNDFDVFDELADASRTQIVIVIGLML